MRTSPRKNSKLRKDGNAVETGVGWTRVGEGIGFESARGKVG